MRQTRSARLDLGQAISLLRELDGECVLCWVVGGTGAPIRVEGRLVCSGAGHRDAIAFAVGPSGAFTVGAGQFADARREGRGMRIASGTGALRRQITIEPARPKADFSPPIASTRGALPAPPGGSRSGGWLTEPERRWRRMSPPARRLLAPEPPTSRRCPADAGTRGVATTARGLLGQGLVAVLRLRLMQI